MIPSSRTSNPTGSIWFWIAAVVAVVAVGGLSYLALRLDVLVWLARANSWLADTFIHRMGYAGVFVLMFIESSFIPFPSEIIIPPAGDLARRLPDWSLTAVIVLGTAGSLAGAVFNYTLALYLGRPLLLKLIDRFGGYVRMTRPGYDRAEALFQRHGAVSTFTGRLIPGIRQIISLPAGLSRMPLLAFCILTSLGAGIWVVVLALLGYWFGANADLLGARLKELSLWVALGAVALLALYGAYQYRRWRLNREAGEDFETGV